jgi:hypothetical protein
MGGDVPAGQEILDQWSDGQGKHDGADSEGAAEDPTEGEDRYFDDGAGEPDRWSLARNPGHQPIAWARSQVGSYVETGGDADQDDPAEHHRPGHTRHFGRRDDDAGQVDDDPDDDCVEQRAQPVGLAQRQPEEEDGHRDDDRPSSDRQPEASGQPLVQDIPRWHPHPRLQHEPDADAEQDQADQQLCDAAGETLPGDRDQVFQDLNPPTPRLSVEGGRCLWAA